MKIIYLVGVILSCCFITTHATSYHGIGSRVEGDELIGSKTYQSQKTVMPENHTIEFSFPVNKPISFVEMFSNRNIYAEYILSLDQVLRGTVIAFNTTEFELNVSVYGFNTKNYPKNFNSVIIKNAPFQGSIYPDNFDNYDSYDYEELDDFDSDEISVIEVGERQTDDRLLFKEVKATDATKNLTKHELTFYYIDEPYITNARFEVFRTKSAGAVFSQITNHSLKASIYDLECHSLDVEFALYGYEPDQMPHNVVLLSEKSEKPLPSNASFIQAYSHMILYICLFIYKVAELYY